MSPPSPRLHTQARESPYSAESTDSSASPLLVPHPPQRHRTIVLEGAPSFAPLHYAKGGLRRSHATKSLLFGFFGGSVLLLAYSSPRPLRFLCYLCGRSFLNLHPIIHRSNASLTAPGCSNGVKCPASSTITSSAPGIPRANCSCSSGVVRRSSLPPIIAVLHRISARFIIGPLIARSARTCRSPASSPTARAILMNVVFKIMSPSLPGATY